MTKISVGQLAYLSVVLRNKLNGTKTEGISLLNRHFVNNLHVYGRALDKAKALNLTLPRRVGGSKMEKLSAEIQLELGVLPAWKDSNWKEPNWLFLAYLLVFDAQLERNEKRCKSGQRWIHVDAHCRAVHFATKECKSPQDSVILSFLNFDEIQKITESFKSISEGQEFGSVIEANKLAPHGLRETTRCLLEIDELVVKKISPVTQNEIERVCKEQAMFWDKKEDPEAATIRVRGIIHEDLLRRKLQKCLNVQETVKNRKKQSKERWKVISPSPFQNKGNVLVRNIQPFTVQLWITTCFFIVMLTCILMTPQESFSNGIAWWYFQLGAIVVGGFILFSPLIIGEDESPKIDLINLIGMTTIFTVLLLLIGQETYKFGIAWWHFILGGLIGSVSSIILNPLLRALITKERVCFSSNI